MVVSCWPRTPLGTGALGVHDAENVHVGADPLILLTSVAYPQLAEDEGVSPHGQWFFRHVVVESRANHSVDRIRNKFQPLTRQFSRREIISNR